MDPLPAVVGECDATVETAPTATDNCAGVVTGTTSYPLYYDTQGTYTVTWTYDDGNGNVVTQDQIVIVEDITPPEITATTDPFVLKQNNHKYVTFDLEDFEIMVSDNCSELNMWNVKIVRVTSDEPEDIVEDGADGATLNDMVIAEDCASVDLRKERRGDSNGRVYTIYLQVEDESGNASETFVQAFVTHNQFAEVIDDGPVYEVTSDCDLEQEMAMEKSGVIADLPAEVVGYELTNYPNPFNRSTTIQFTIPVETKVMIKVYNIFGQEIETVVNQRHRPGTHIVKYDATGLPKGYYLYKLKTTDNSITKKMILR